MLDIAYPPIGKRDNACSCETVPLVGFRLYNTRAVCYNKHGVTSYIDNMVKYVMQKQRIGRTASSTLRGGPCV